MKFLCGIETEYGLLIREGDGRGSSMIRQEELFRRVRDYLFFEKKAGLIDLHQRAYDEPPGNGGFLRNGGRLYIDMGHVEYASPECGTILDLVAMDRAGDLLLEESLRELGLSGSVSFIKNNIDHQTLATFGSHENYSVPRSFPFNEKGLDPLVAFLVTRQIFSGAGRVGASIINDSLISLDNSFPSIPYQISQRADYVVNKFYQWVQMNRSIVNTRDEPLADPLQFRRIHLLLGDSNMSQYALALKAGTTRLVLALIERGEAPWIPVADPVQAIRSLSHDLSMTWPIEIGGEGVVSAVEIQGRFYEAAEKAFRGESDDSDWILDAWNGILTDLEKKDPAVVADRIDWAQKYVLLETFRKEEGLSWDDPWMESLDLAYHDLNPDTGLFYPLEEEGSHRRLVSSTAIRTARDNGPAGTRAQGRSEAVARILDGQTGKMFNDYIIQWFGVQVNGGEILYMLDPYKTYRREVATYFSEASHTAHSGE
ncbi:MAG: proteasome accessory factor PafA2 family protein [Nitrospiraceae bacterium]|nr:proteasome accessory factor PafA2 family protein [Nitrospiraceae bacterium]